MIGNEYVKWLAALLILSQGSLIYTFGYRTGKARVTFALVFLLHLICAGIIFWLG
jgi:hypothetical protein